MMYMVSNTNASFATPSVDMIGTRGGRLLSIAVLVLSVVNGSPWVREMELKDKQFSNSSSSSMAENTWKCAVYCDKDDDRSLTYNEETNLCTCYPHYNNQSFTEQPGNKYFLISVQSCERARKSGVYKFQANGAKETYNVYCEVNSPEDSWLVFQRRLDGTESFERTFDEYSKGFGDMNGEFWLGNDIIHSITSAGQWQLRVDIVHKVAGHEHVIYTNFKLGDAAAKYRLTVGSKIAGNIGDYFTYHNNRRFSTQDQDNDDSSAHCSEILKSGWWYGDCKYTDLNDPIQLTEQCVAEYDFRRGRCTTKIEMKMRAVV